MRRACKNCGQNIPSEIRIDGKIRNLGSRRYCLVCRPFLSAKGKPPRAGPQPVVSRLCRRCQRTFGYKSGSGMRRSLCGSCTTSERRDKIKAALVSMKGGRCEKCGYDREMAALSFHHRDPLGKDFSIGQNTNRSWASLVTEVEKCDLLCVRCHVEVHAELARSSRINAPSLLEAI